MATSAQAIKRIRQNQKHRLANRSVKSELRTLTKRLETLVSESAAEGDANADAGAKKAAAESLLRTLVSKLDKAARRRVIHQNAAARKKSQLARLVSGTRA